MPGDCKYFLVQTPDCTVACQYAIRTASGLTEGCLGCRLEVGEGTATERGVRQHSQRFHRQEGQLLFPSSDW